MNNESYFSFAQIETLNRLTVDLYDDRISVHNRVVNFFQMFMEIVNFDRASVLFFYKDKDDRYTKKSSISVNWNTQSIKKYDSYYCHIDDTLPVLDQPYPIIIRSSSFFNHELRKETEYWKDYLVPNNSIYELVANLQLQNSQNIRGSFAFYRGEGNSDFTDHELRIIKMFQPHLSAMLRYYWDDADAAGSFASLENYNCMGLCILNENFQIIRKNGVFERLNIKSENAILCKAIQLCNSINQTPNRTQSISSEYKLEDEPIFLEVICPSEKSETAAKQYCCMVYDLSYFFNSTLVQAKDTYNLSVREFEILVRILKGQRNEEIAQELYLSLPTIKKHLNSIYSKLEITNQKQIFKKLKLID